MSLSESPVLPLVWGGGVLWVFFSVIFRIFWSFLSVLVSCINVWPDLDLSGVNCLFVGDFATFSLSVFVGVRTLWQRIDRNLTLSLQFSLISTPLHGINCNLMHCSPLSLVLWTHVVCVFLFLSVFSRL